MKAIVIAQRGGTENLCLVEYSKPDPEKGMVLIQVKAFGINRAEVYMRRGEWGETSDIIGIECVGIVEEDLSGQFPKGVKVAAVCGGMARTINGSYAEYVNVPASNVISLTTGLPWDEPNTGRVARIPISYQIREYWQEFFTRHVLVARKIIPGEKWRYDDVTLTFMDGDRYDLLDPTRFEFAQFLIKTALNLLFNHELAHIIFGHLDYLGERQQISVL